MSILSVRNVLTMLIVFFAYNLHSLGNEFVQAEVRFIQEEQQGGSYPSYVPGNRRDPFQSILETAQSITIETAKYDDMHLTGASWKVLGIMSGAKGTQAVLRNARGHRYIVSSGDIVGAGHVRVMHLTQSSVTLEFVTSEVRQQSRLAPQTIELTLGQ